jgi:hypothetical protein
MGSRIEQYRPYLFSDGCSAGFARSDYLDLLGAENGCKAIHLRGLAAAIEPFESDEFASLHHAGIITFGALQVAIRATSLAGVAFALPAPDGGIVPIRAKMCVGGSVREPRRLC